MYRLSMCCAVAFALVVGFTGCPAGDAGPAVEYVEGVVTLDGETIEGVTVGFSPVGEGGIGATGATDSKGVFKLTAAQGGEPDDGAVAGEYTVTFRKVTQDFAEALTPDDPGYEESMASEDESSAAPAFEYVVPAKYGNPAKSEFKVTVKSGKNTGDDFKFDLTSE